jgi:putative endonuclease
MSKTQKRLIGDIGEDFAAIFLTHKGYEIIAKNFQIKTGELDIVAWHEKPRFGKTLCFVEVKTRELDDGSAERATGYNKLQRMFSAAKAFCLRHKIPTETTPIQFEHVSVYNQKNQSEPTIRHFVIPVD